jgi:hypothetical protein
MAFANRSGFERAKCDRRQFKYRGVSVIARYGKREKRARIKHYEAFLEAFGEQLCLKFLQSLYYNFCVCSLDLDLKLINILIQ